MKVLGHEFTDMTKQDWYAYAGAEPGTLICHLDNGVLLYDPETRVISEIRECEGQLRQSDWSAEKVI